MHIALFGGSFDPPHQAHQIIAQYLLDQKIADEVWYVPVGEHHFAKKMSPAKNRVAMLQGIINSSRIKIENYELNHSGISYSYGTLLAMSKKYPQHTFSWIIGSDNLASFHKWHEYKKLLAKFTVYVYPRQGFPFQPLYPGMVPLEGVKRMRTSSTIVREKIRTHLSIARLVDPKVAQYIKVHRLYI